jgi:hypothetical protein
MPLQIRRGTNAERLSLTPTTGLKEGELIYVTDEQRLYVGTGVTGQHQGLPVTNLTVDDAKDAAGAALTGGSHTNISFTYNNLNSTINATVDLSTYSGVIRADALRGSIFAEDSSLILDAETGTFYGLVEGDTVGYHTGDVKGSVFADNSTRLVDSVNGNINLAGTISDDVYPSSNEEFDLGTPTARFKDLYLSGSSIHLGDAVITADGTTVNLPAGSTVNGVLIGSGAFGDGVVSGSEYNISIVADDSSLIIDSSTGMIYGDVIGDTSGYHTGDVKGSVFADDSSTLVDAVAGVLRGTLVGNLNGNVFGDLIGNTTGYHTGDIKGSVFADDSTLLVDALSGTIYGYFEGQATINALKIYSDVWFRDIGVSIYSASNTGDGGWVDCKVSANTTADPQPLSNSDFVGGFRIQGYTSNDEFVTSAVYGSEIGATADLNSSNPASDAIIGVANDEDFTLFRFKNDGTYVAPGAVQLAVFADDAARALAIPTPAQGMMVFMQTGTVPAVTNKAVIFDGTSWTTL